MCNVVPAKMWYVFLAHIKHETTFSLFSFPLYSVPAGWYINEDST